MKILLPTDGSRFAEAALRAAVAMVKERGGELLVAHVVPSFQDFDLELSAAGRAGLQDELARQGEKVTAAALDAAAKEGVKASSKIVASVSSTAEALVELAEKEKADLIVMGSHGKASSPRFRLGSVASRVVKHSPCSVYVVKI